MTRISSFTCLFILMCFTALTGPSALGALPDNTNCLMCHSAPSITKAAGGEQVSVHVDPSSLRQSIHDKLKCVQCHADLQDRPQKHGTPAPVQCARCHEHTTKALDVVHANVKRDKATPVCKDCHGSHDVKPVKDPLSRVSRENSIGTCAKCHEKEKTLRAYQSSVHGSIKAEGEMPAAVCSDCHKVHEFPPLYGRHLSSLPSKRDVNCVQCHTKQASDYLASAHGTARAKGDLNAPDCVDCHGGHGVLNVSDSRSAVSKANEPRTCAKCHEDEKLMAQYDLPANSLKTYRHSYHGKANLHGSTEAATCSDCHSAHAVLASSDPASPTNKKNLGKTCAKCHPGVNMNVGKGKIHVEISREDSALLYYIANGFKWLTVGTMIMLCGHIGLDLFSRLRRRLMDSLRRGG